MPAEDKIQQFSAVLLLAEPRLEKAFGKVGTEIWDMWRPPLTNTNLRHPCLFVSDVLIHIGWISPNRRTKLQSQTITTVG